MAMIPSGIMHVVIYKPKDSAAKAKAKAKGKAKAKAMAAHAAPMLD